MIRVLRLIEKDCWWRAHVVDHHIDGAIIINVPERYASSALQNIVESGLGGDFLESPISFVVIQEKWLGKVCARYGIVLRKDVAVCGEDIGQSIVVKIDETRAPTHELMACLAYL